MVWEEDAAECAIPQKKVCGAEKRAWVRLDGMGLLVLALLLAGPGGRERQRISSDFGTRVDPIHGRRAVHRGIDLPGAVGTPIVAAAAGIVRRAGWRGGYGQMIELAHADGTVTRYAHLSAILVRPGEAVGQGQRIARMGSTGRSTGSHLHFEYRVAGRAVDPLGYIGTVPPPSPKPRPIAETIPHRSRFAQQRAAAPADRAGLPTGEAAMAALDP